MKRTHKFVRRRKRIDESDLFTPVVLPLPKVEEKEEEFEPYVDFSKLKIEDVICPSVDDILIADTDGDDIEEYQYTHSSMPDAVPDPTDDDDPGFTYDQSLILSELYSVSKDLTTLEAHIWDIKQKVCDLICEVEDGYTTDLVGNYEINDLKSAI